LLLAKRQKYQRLVLRLSPVHIYAFSLVLTKTPENADGRNSI